MLVYVLNQNSQPLMPCSPCKARKLLKQGKAMVFKTEPFAIRLLHVACGNNRKKLSVHYYSDKYKEEDGRIEYVLGIPPQP